MPAQLVPTAIKPGSISLITSVATSRKWAPVVEAFLVEVEKRSGSRRTPTEYRRYLKRFFALVDDPAQAAPAHVHAFAYGIGPSGREAAPSTVLVRLAALQGFFDFARRMKLVAENPATDVKRPRRREPTPKGLDPSELRRLLAAVPANSVGLRDRAIIVGMVLTGLRREELLGLRKKDVTRNGGVYYSVRTKGGVVRRRELPLPVLDLVVQALHAERRSFDALDPEARIFSVSPHGFYLNLRRYAKRAGLVGVTPHVLRHSAAKLRRVTGESLEAVSSFLGHRSLATTASYLKRLEGEEDRGWTAVAPLLGLGSSPINSEGPSASR